MLTVRQVMDGMKLAGQQPAATVDLLEAGRPDMEVKGIVTAFKATYEVIRRAAALGANLVITHEALYYRHRDGERGLEHDGVAAEKRRLIRESGMAIYRNHDAVHRATPDLITAALAADLGWASYVAEHRPHAALLDIPAMPLRQLAEQAKRRLGLPFVRLVGDPDLTFSRIALLVGYRGGEANAVPLMAEADLIIAGEGPEWETPEYVRDAVRQGQRKALLLLGHAESEEPGMRALAAALRERYPSVPVTFIPVGPLFQVV